MSSAALSSSLVTAGNNKAVTALPKAKKLPSCSGIYHRDLKHVTDNSKPDKVAGRWSVEMNRPMFITPEQDLGMCGEPLGAQAPTGGK